MNARKLAHEYVEFFCKDSALKHAWRELMLGFTLEYEGLVKIKDCWMINRRTVDSEEKDDQNFDMNDVSDKKSEITKCFYFVIDDCGDSIQKLSLTDLKRDPNCEHSKITFELWQKVALETIKLLIYLKSEGVIHRDIKVNNLLLRNLHNPARTKRVVFSTIFTSFLQHKINR